MGVSEPSVWIRYSDRPLLLKFVAYKNFPNGSAASPNGTSEVKGGTTIGVKLPLAPILNLEIAPVLFVKVLSPPCKQNQLSGQLRLGKMPSLGDRERGLNWELKLMRHRQRFGMPRVSLYPS